MKSILLSVLYIANAALMIHGLYFAVLGISGFFRKAREYPETDSLRHFAVLVPARNEETVVGELVDSIRRADYPAELIDVYVIANNCTDSTAKVAESRGATVIPCEFPARTKGEVLRYAFGQLEEHEEIDAYAVFDADNIVDPAFFAEMNKALASGVGAAQGKRIGKNPADSWIAATYEIFYALQDAFYNHPRSATGESASVNGTGWVVAKELIERQGFEMKTVAEDYEFTIQCALSGETVGYCKKAITYDEYVADLRTSMVQRIRWSCGHVQNARAYGRRLYSKAFWNSASCRDNAMLILLPWVSLLSLIPFFGGIAVAGLAVPYPLYLVFAAFMVWLGTSLVALIAVIISRGDVRGHLKGILTFALFIITWLPLMIAAIFMKGVEWTPIRHGEQH